MKRLLRGAPSTAGQAGDDVFKVPSSRAGRKDSQAAEDSQAGEQDSKSSMAKSRHVVKSERSRPLPRGDSTAGATDVLQRRVVSLGKRARPKPVTASASQAAPPAMGTVVLPDDDTSTEIVMRKRKRKSLSPKSMLSNFAERDVCLLTDLSCTQSLTRLRDHLATSFSPLTLQSKLPRPAAPRSATRSLALPLFPRSRPSARPFVPERLLQTTLSPRSVFRRRRQFRTRMSGRQAIGEACCCRVSNRKAMMGALRTHQMQAPPRRKGRREFWYPTRSSVPLVRPVIHRVTTFEHRGEPWADLDGRVASFLPLRQHFLRRLCTFVRWDGLERLHSRRRGKLELRGSCARFKDGKRDVVSAARTSLTQTSSRPERPALNFALPLVRSPLPTGRACRVADLLESNTSDRAAR